MSEQQKHESPRQTETFDLLETLTELDPATLEVEQSVGEGLILRSPEIGEETNVSVKACFPVTRPRRFLRFKDEDDEDIGILDDMDDLDAESCRALEEELTRQQFMPVITRIHAIYREFAIPVWEVDTDRGPRRIELKSTRDVHRLGGGRIYVRDSEGNGYVIPSARDLDPESRALLELYV